MSNSLTRLYCSIPIVIGQELVVTNKEKLHHISTVLRLKKKDKLLIFNEQHGEFLVTIFELSKSSITLLPEQQTKSPEKHIKINIASAIIKPERFRFLIEKCTEIGCTSFTPLLTSRTIVRKLNHDKVMSYALGAAEQCGRCDIPEILQETSLKIFLQNTKDQLVFCDERPTTQTIKQLNIENTVPISVLIGPEGGFTDEEHDMITKYSHVHRVSLGKYILRAETAAITALSLLINK